MRPRIVNLLETIRLQDHWADIDDTWQLGMYILWVGGRPTSRSRKLLRLAEDILRLASRLSAAYGLRLRLTAKIGWRQPIIEGHGLNIL